MTTQAKDPDLVELIQLCAVDGVLFSRAFFPDVVRQTPPPFHRQLWDLLSSYKTPLVNILAFRGSGKTTILRLFIARSMAYAVSRTILYIGKSEDAALSSAAFLRRQIERNQLFSSTFGLEPARPWTDSHFVVHHSVEDCFIHFLAIGITGSVRGINLDAYRPDLIILDDIMDDENSSTKDGRQKITNLVYGAIRNTLAPRSEAPHSKMISIATPQDEDDYAMKAAKDPAWAGAVYPIWTDDTIDEPIDKRISRWPERFPTEDEKAEARAAAFRGQYHIYARERECRITAPETSAFKLEWLRYYIPGEEPDGLSIYIAIDPVPKPTEKQIAKGQLDTDFEAFSVVGRAPSGATYLLDYTQNRGHDPGWTRSMFMSLCLKWRPKLVVIEATAYQSTLSFILGEEMRLRGIWFPIEEIRDRRAKSNRIIAAISDRAALGFLYVQVTHADFLTAYTSYSTVRPPSHDDLLDATSIALDAAAKYTPLVSSGSAIAAIATDADNVIELRRALERHPLLVRAP